MSKSDLNGAPLVVHVIHRLTVGGLENGVVNLINRMPGDRYRHAIVCLTDADSFRERLSRRDVEVIELHKRPGQDPGLYLRLAKAYRQLRPAVVHTRNLATLEAQLPAALTGVPVRVHGEHGWDVPGAAAVSRKHSLLRRLMRPFVSHYVALSAEAGSYLVDRIGVRAKHISQIINGVDTQRFRPGNGTDLTAAPWCKPTGSPIVMGSVGRMESVKDPMNLARAFAAVLAQRPHLRARLRLLMVGDGALLEQVRNYLGDRDLLDLTWLPGRRNDVPELMRSMDVFVLPSLAEGISNTILEAMAIGLPVIGTRVGGNPELIAEGVTGVLVPAASPTDLANAIIPYAESADLRQSHGRAGRRRVLELFSLERMVADYAGLYDRLLKRQPDPIPCR